MFRSPIHRICAAALAIAIASVLFFGGSAAWAEDQTGGLPGEWLSRYLGARTAGVGGAFVAAADDPTGVVWNPAGLSLLAQNEVLFETTRLYESTSINTLSFAVPGRRIPSFGITILSLGSGDFERTNELNESLGEFKEGEMAFLLSASKNVTRKLYLGANLKVARQSVEDFSGSGVGADIGMLYQLTPALRLGASLLNIGGPTVSLRSTDEKYPIDFRGGLAVYFLSGRALVSGEIDHRSDAGTGFRFGTEFWVHSSLGLRFGYSEEAPAGGFSFRVTPGMQFDYAAVNEVLGVTHRIGLSYRFGGFYASSQADPPVFSPIGERSVTKFHLAAKTKADADGWTLEIVDKSNQLVRRFSGKGVPPAHVMWDGKDETGLPLPDGVYKYRLVVVDLEGRELDSHVREVEITTEGPKGAVPVFTNR